MDTKALCLDKSISVRDALSEALSCLNLSAIANDTAFLDASILLAFALGISRDKLLASMPDKVDAHSLAKFSAYIKRRSLGEPIAYILGRKEFYGRSFIVNNSVLVPRPETEMLVEAAMAIIKSLPRTKPALVHDAFCGSGCVGISIVAECIAANIDIDMSLSDISTEALVVAKQNSKNILGFTLPVFESNFLSAAKLLSRQGHFDIIVANPPYVKSDCVNLLYDEPKLALDGGHDGLDLYPRLVHEARELCSAFIVEIGDEHAEAVSALFTAEGFTGITVGTDLALRHRMVTGFMYEH